MESDLNKLQMHLDRLSTLHDHICPRQILGLRIGMYASERLGLDLPQTNKRLLTFVETDGCFADGIFVATGCSLGHRTLRLIDYGKVAATFVDTQSNEAIRIWPHPDSRKKALSYAPAERDHWHSQLKAYQIMPTEDLLCGERVTPMLSIEAIISRPGVRVVCDNCGEEILNEREIVREGWTLCRACAGDHYYATAEKFSLAMSSISSALR
jgi:formylmethanofuran dehydrogenase subunit E